MADGISNRDFPCKYSRGVDCMELLIYRAKAYNEEFHKCLKCGWNPNVSKARLQKLKGEKDA